MEMSRIPSLYSTNWRTRAFLEARFALTPYTQMASYFPKQGKILDLGCGHGLLALTLARDSADREILAFDHDSVRIAMAKQAGQGLSPRLRFEIGGFEKLATEGLFAGIAAIDVLHYFNTSEQERILKQTYSALLPGGVFVFREVNPEGGVWSKINGLHEQVMTKIGFTKATELHFRQVADWKAISQATGFEVTVIPMNRPPFADVLFVCYKTDK